MFSIKESISKKFEKKYKQKDFYDRFVTLYLVSIPVSTGCLVWSFFPSYNFYLAYFRPFDDPFWNMILAGFLSIAQSVMIGVISQSIRNDIFRNQVTRVTGILAIVNLSLMGWNGGVDWYGSPELASSMFEAPIDEETPKVDATYELQVANLTATKKATEDRINYVKKGCKTDDCYVTGGKAYHNGSPTPYQKKELRRLEKKLESQSADINMKQDEWNVKKEESQNSFANIFQNYETRVNRRTGVLRGFVFGLMIVFALCEYWKGFFGLQVGLRKSVPVTKTEIPKKKKRKKEKTKSGKKKKGKKSKTEISHVGKTQEDIEKMLEKLMEKKLLTESLNGKFQGYETMRKKDDEKPDKNEEIVRDFPVSKTQKKVLFTSDNQPDRKSGKKERTKAKIIAAKTEIERSGKRASAAEIARNIGMSDRRVRDYLKEINQ